MSCSCLLPQACLKTLAAGRRWKLPFQSWKPLSPEQAISTFKAISNVHTQTHKSFANPLHYGLMLNVSPQPCTQGPWCTGTAGFTLREFLLPQELYRPSLRNTLMWVGCTVNAGDLLAALLLARLDQKPNDMKMAIEMALASLQAIVYKTYEYSTRHLEGKQLVPEVCSLVPALFWMWCLQCKADQVAEGEYPINCQPKKS